MSSRFNTMLQALEYNCSTCFKNLLIRRDNKVVLFGAWMGTKFADNSRYLYQYLYENKDELNLTKIIWVTRDTKVRQDLEMMGYEVYLIGSKDSNYWHLKAGMHVICNAAFDILDFKPDIDTKYSFGAKKIQLWHGVGGIKAVGGASNKARETISKKTLLKRILRSHRFNTFFTLGGWGEAHILATGQECANSNIQYSNCREDRVFLSGYPRNCECIKLLPSEQRFIDYLTQYNGCLLYLPTFRSDNSHFIHPLTDSKIIEFINNNNLLWIEKPHTADKNKDANANADGHVYNLDPNFDINTIYKYMSCVITDYSSVAFDAVYHSIPLAIYAPDIEEFRNGDIGFLIDFENLFSKMLSTNIDKLYGLIESAMFNREMYMEERQKDLSKLREYAFDNKKKTYKEIWDDICSLK